MWWAGPRRELERHGLPDQRCRALAVGPERLLPGSGVVVTTQDGGTPPGPRRPRRRRPSVHERDLHRAGRMHGTGEQRHRGVVRPHHRLRADLDPEGTSRPRSSSDADLSCVPGGACLVPGYAPTSAGHGRESAIALAATADRPGRARCPPGQASSKQSCASLRRLAWPRVRPPPRSATSPQPRARCLGRTTAATTVVAHSATGRRHLRASPALRPTCAVVGPTGPTVPPSPRVRLAQSRDGGTKLSPLPCRLRPITLTAWPARARPAASAVGGIVVARITARAAPAAAHTTFDHHLTPGSAPGPTSRGTRPTASDPRFFAASQGLEEAGSLGSGGQTPVVLRRRRTATSVAGCGPAGLPPTRAWRTAMPKTCPQCQSQAPDDANHCFELRGAPLVPHLTTAQAVPPAAGTAQAAPAVPRSPPRRFLRSRPSSSMLATLTWPTHRGPGDPRPAACRSSSTWFGITVIGIHWPNERTSAHGWLCSCSSICLGHPAYLGAAPDWATCPSLHSSVISR